MIIQHNIPAMNAMSNLTRNQNGIKGNLEKLSSGYKINRAGDDAAGLAISEKMRAQITGLDQAYDNVEDGISLIQTAEGALQEIHDILNRLVELGVQAANGTYDDDVDRAALQEEVESLKAEINRISDSTNFNGIPLFTDGWSFSGSTGGSGFPSTLNIDTGLVSTVGAFTVTGGVQGVDFDYDPSTNVLTILSSTDMRIEGGSNADQIVVDDGAGSANLALKNVNINSTDGSAFYTGNNDVYIELEGFSTLSSISSYSAGLTVDEFGSLTLTGNGSLTASGGTNGAGIGGASGEDAGNITILGGNIKATGGDYAAGIGAGQSIGMPSVGGTVGDIFIQDAIITATGGYLAAGIGSGSSNSTVGDITILGGSVTATGGGLGAEDIGLGYNTSNSVGAITIGDSPTSGSSSYYTEYGNIILQIGAACADFNRLEVPVISMRCEAMGIAIMDISTQDEATFSIDLVRDAVNYVSDHRSSLGACQNRLEHTRDNLSVMIENIQDAESTIRDTDIAEEMMKYTKNTILIQSAQSMLAQANQLPQGILQLLG